MENFTKHVLVAQGFYPEFFFNKIHTATGLRYHVSVKDKENNPYFFDMEEKEGKWKIIDAPKVPDWIMNIEQKLENAIFENIVNNLPRERR